MKKPTKTVTSIGVVAFIIAAAITGLAGISGTAWSGYDRMILLFVGIFVGVFVLGWALDRAARNAAGAAAADLAGARIPGAAEAR